MIRVLYVEDNDDNAYMLGLRFASVEGYEMLVATNGEAGLRLALAERPDIVLMDLELPEVDGWEATRRLKADPRTSAIPIIALTAHAMAGARETALAAGCDEFDTKPVNFERLLQKIATIVVSAQNSAAARKPAPGTS